MSIIDNRTSPLGLELRERVGDKLSSNILIHLGVFKAHIDRTGLRVKADETDASRISSLQSIHRMGNLFWVTYYLMLEIFFELRERQTKTQMELCLY